MSPFLARPRPLDLLPPSSATSLLSIPINLLRRSLNWCLVLLVLLWLLPTVCVDLKPETKCVDLSSLAPRPFLSWAPGSVVRPCPERIVSVELGLVASGQLQCAQHALAVLIGPRQLTSRIGSTQCSELRAWRRQPSSAVQRGTGLALDPSTTRSRFHSPSPARWRPRSTCKQLVRRRSVFPIG